MPRPTLKMFFRLALGITLLTLFIAGLFIIKERQTLSRLAHPERGVATTLVYSRWLDLKTHDPCTWDRVLAWLQMLDYARVEGRPTQAGQFSKGTSSLTIFIRSFHYPDRDYPAQLLELDFSGQHLSGLKALAGQAELAQWRLEPKLLAEWDSGTKASRLHLRISDLPPYVPRAVIAMEDKRFFEHGAFDMLGIARALWVDLRHAELRQGASTITQQLSRSIFLDVQRTWRRKTLEAVMALYLQVRYSKPQLLEMYLNQVYWGQDGPQTLVGMESASLSFFGKPARQLTPAESAILAGMLQSPRRYSPRNGSAVSEERKRIVLGLMKDQKFITEDQYRLALQQRLSLVPVKKSNDSSYFLGMLREELGKRYELPALLSQGWQIYTTLDPLLQKAAVEALKPPVGQAGLVAIDPRTGALLAWVGGTNFQTNPFDHAIDAKRQPGSAFKPFVVLAALESRKMTTATLLDDAPLTLKGANGSWTPQNYDRKYLGKVSVWDSLVQSRNVPIVRLAMQVGVEPIVAVARRAGIESPLREDLSLALGSSEVSLAELTRAYTTLASGGKRVTPYSIQAVVGENGQLLEYARSFSDQVMAPEATFLVTQMLEAVLDVGTGKASHGMGMVFPAAGKTGTSENYQDAWFVGYTSAVVCGVWVGYDKPQSLGHSAAGIALPLWVDFMKKAAPFNPPQDFEEPLALNWKTIDPESGLLAKTGCLQRRKTAFLAGTEPTEDCPLHAGGLTGLFKRWRAKP